MNKLYEFIFVDIEQLKAENIRFRKALEFYADRTNWISSGKGLSIYWFDLIKDDSEQSPDNNREHISGKTAREALFFSLKKNESEE